MDMVSAGPFATFASPAFADLDGDNDPDLVCGSAAGTLDFFRNDGNGAANFVLVEAAQSPFGNYSVAAWSAPALADMNGDNLFDLVVGGGDGALHYYENIGGKAQPAYGTVAESPVDSISVNAGARPTFVDLEGDARRGNLASTRVAREGFCLVDIST